MTAVYIPEKFLLQLSEITKRETVSAEPLL